MDYLPESGAAATASLHAHYRSLGELCVSWAVLDRKLTDVASVLINRGPEVAACVFSSGENLKPRCEAIKKLVLIEPLFSESEWPARLTELVNTIQNKVAPRRNRFVHDEWYVGADEIVRVQLGSRVHKEPHKSAELRYAQFHRSSTGEVDALIREVKTLTHQLTLVAIIITSARLVGGPVDSFWDLEA